MLTIRPTTRAVRLGTWSMGQRIMGETGYEPRLDATFNSPTKLHTRFIRQQVYPFMTTHRAMHEPSSLWEGVGHRRTKLNMLGTFSPQSPLVVLDMANNHGGDVEHGHAIIRAISEVARDSHVAIAVKFQFRNLDSYVHPSFQGRTDLKYVRRFEETRLSWGEFRELFEHVRDEGLLTACTPFDEDSVRLVQDFGFDILKIASASATDWRLLETAVATKMPMIVSTGGLETSTLDRLVRYLSRYASAFALMHCVSLYPTPTKFLNLQRIGQLRRRYPKIPIGYSTHESPDNTSAAGLAVALGATILERHFGIPKDQSPLNGYSSSPIQLKEWLDELRDAATMLGHEGTFAESLPEERQSLEQLERGLYAKREIKQGQTIGVDDIQLAFPRVDGQLSASDLSLENRIVSQSTVSVGQPVEKRQVKIEIARRPVLEARDAVVDLIKRSGIEIPLHSELEVSHHYGIERFSEVGMSMITTVNRAYCKKFLFLLPGQRHPEQYHKVKDETFQLLYGDCELILDGTPQHLDVGQVITIEPNVRHAFSSSGGCVLEEISSTHHSGDSYYVDEAINQNSQRKSFVGLFAD